MDNTKLLFVVGFLGSGKTTLLQYLLQEYPSDKIGIVLNDFGTASIDEQLFSLHPSNKKGIANGSVFCSCRSDQLVSTVVTMADNELDLIVVEASGLANPGTMYPIIEWILKKSKVPLDYIGSIGVVDACNYLKMKTSNIIKNQLLYSDLILLNKVDTISDEHKNEIISSIKSIQTTSPIVSTNWSRFDLDLLQSINPKRSSKQSFGLSLNTQAFSLDPSNLSWDQVWTLCQALSTKVHRIKGFYKKNTTSIYIECVSGTCTLQELSINVSNGLEFLTDDPYNLETIIQDEYNRITGK